MNSSHRSCPTIHRKDFDECYSLALERRYPLFTKPIRLKIGADVEKSVTSWKAVVHEVIAWLIDTEKLTDNHFPIKVKEKTFISREAVNRDGTPFKDPQQLPKDLILQRRYRNDLGSMGEIKRVARPTSSGYKRDSSVLSAGRKS